MAQARFASAGLDGQHGGGLHRLARWQAEREQRGSDYKSGGGPKAPDEPVMLAMAHAKLDRSEKVDALKRLGRFARATEPTTK